MHSATSALPISLGVIISTEAPQFAWSLAELLAGQAARTPVATAETAPGCIAEVRLILSHPCPPRIDSSRLVFDVLSAAWTVFGICKRRLIALPHSAVHPPIRNPFPINNGPSRAQRPFFTQAIAHPNRNPFPCTANPPVPFIHPGPHR